MDARGEIAQVGEPLAGLLGGGCAERGGGGRVRVGAPLGHLHRQQRADELLLRAVVQVAGDLGAGGVGRLDDAAARGAQLAARAAATSRSRAASSARSCSSMSVHAVTAPRPSGRSNGAVE